MRAAFACLLLLGCPQEGMAPLEFVAVTFNTGTTEGMAHDQGPDDGYSSEHAVISDTWYGDGLAWLPAVESTRAWLAELQPDLISFQEIFYSELCPGIPPEARADFVCESWQAGDPTVVELILGEGYQIMCNPGHDDKCSAVRRGFGSFAACDGDFCLEGMEGFTVAGCGNGARVGRARVDVVDGGSLTLVSMHGSSGLAADDMACRVQQIEQVFLDLGDGEPGAKGQRNLILGDFNTDPARWAAMDESARRWLQYAAPQGEELEGRAFRFVTEVSTNSPGTYAGSFNIDHQISDVATGSCWSAGVSPGHEAVTDARYFDHVPVVCSLEIPQE